MPDEVHEISRLIGVLQAQQQSMAEQCARLEQAMTEGFNALARRMDALIKDVRENAQANAQEVANRFGGLEKRVESIEKRLAAHDGANRAHKLWATGLGASAGAIISFLLDHWQNWWHR